jgi:hypothetical protein
VQPHQLVYFLLLLLAPMEHRPVTIIFQVHLSFPSISNSNQILLILHLFFIKSLFHLLFGLPLLLVSCRFQDKVCLVKVPCGFRNVLPVHLHFVFLISSSILTCHVFTHKHLSIVYCLAPDGGC